jgi:O-antigen ligase
MAHGLYPGLSPVDSLRSLIGSAAPFAFFFCRPPRRWAEAMLAAVRWCPVIAVAGGVILALTGIRPLFIDSGGWRLSGLGHPAFLAGVALAGLYACLIEVYRTCRPGQVVLWTVNLAILVLTGARAPTACAGAVLLLSLVFVRSPTLPARARVLLVLSALAILPVLLLLAGDLSSLRLFHLLTGDRANLSGREYLWSSFEAAAAGSPWFGWGIGAGNVIVPPESPVARLLHTWAAHNEYLRILVEGGQIGRTLLLLLFLFWGRLHTARLPHAERWIMRLALLGLAAQAVTDNVLISTPACVMFAFVAAVCARGEHEPGPGNRFALPASTRLA